jgi:hypothetical protein
MARGIFEVCWNRFLWAVHLLMQPRKERGSSPFPEQTLFRANAAPDSPAWVHCFFLWGCRGKGQVLVALRNRTHSGTHRASAPRCLSGHRWQ